MKRTASAALLVAILDGTQNDVLVHYVCGAIAAKPNASAAGRPLPRRILLVEEPGEREKSLVADSLRRCEKTVRVVSPGNVYKEIAKFCREYQTWRDTPAKGERK